MQCPIHSSYITKIILEKHNLDIATCIECIKVSVKYGMLFIFLHVLTSSMKTLP